MRPYGLRFTGEGAGLAVVVVDSGNNRVSELRAGDGTFVRHLTTGVVGPYDVEECEGGWLVACGGSDSVDFVRSGADGEDGAGGVVADASCIGGDGDAGGSGVTDSCGGRGGGGGGAGGGAGSGGCGGEPLERGGVRAVVLPTSRLGKRGRGHGEFHDPTALAWVPGIGLVVRDWVNGSLQFFADREDIAMASMSPHRVAWMVAVARGVASRAAAH
jgi:hypothetical protein